MDTQTPSTQLPDLPNLNARLGQTHHCEDLRAARAIVEQNRQRDIISLQQYHSAISQSHPAIIAQIRQIELAHLSAMEDKVRGPEYLQLQDKGRTVVFRTQKFCFPDADAADDFVRERRSEALGLLKFLRERVMRGDGEFFAPEREGLMASLRYKLRTWEVRDQMPE